MQCSMGTGLLRQGKCLNFLWLLSVNTHFPDEHSHHHHILFGKAGYVMAAIADVDLL